LTTGAKPTALQIQRAEAALTTEVLDYLHVLIILGRALPQTNDLAWLEERARCDIDTWVDGLFSRKPISVPPDITDVLVQRAAIALGLDKPFVPPRMAAPEFAPYAERYFHVVKIGAGFCVFPSVIVRGNSELIEVTRTKLFHVETLKRSGWKLQWNSVSAVPKAKARKDEGSNAGVRIKPADDQNKK
jgi:hypothetical protein